MNRQTAHFEDREPFLEKILSWLRYRKIVKKIPQNSKILDLGCGYNANFIKEISYKNCKYTGIDISINTKLDSNNISLIKHDLNEKLPFDNEVFDVVISLANLEHLISPESNLNEIYRVLKPNGSLLLTTPSIYAKPILEFLSFKLHLISKNEIMDHKNYFNKDILLKMCKRTGFSSIKHKYFQFFMNNFIKAIKR